MTWGAIAIGGSGVEKYPADQWYRSPTGALMPRSQSALDALGIRDMNGNPISVGDWARGFTTSEGPAGQSDFASQYTHPNLMNRTQGNDFGTWLRGTTMAQITAGALGLGAVSGPAGGAGAGASGAGTVGAGTAGAGATGAGLAGGAGAAGGLAGTAGATGAGGAAAGAAGAGGAAAGAGASSWIPLAGAGVGAVGSYIAADKATGAITDAANTNAGMQKYIFDRNTQLNDPFYQQGLSALPDLQGSIDNRPPSYEDTVYKPMESWDYEQSPAYKAQYGLASEELNRQLQARGLSASGIGANRAADLSRRLTADDYTSERSYETGRRTDLYKGRLSENTDRYNKLLDQVKMATGAASTMGQAGNQYADSVGRSTMQAGEARAGFYSGLPGTTMNTVATGLKAYDTGQRAGWWGNSNTATFPQSNSNALPTQAELAPFDSLYG